MTKLELIQNLKNNTIQSPFAFPTETVFGIFAPVSRYDLISQIYQIKKRSLDKKLMMMFHEFGSVQKYYELNDYQIAFIKKYQSQKVSFVCPLLEIQTLHAQCYEEIDGVRWSGFRITSFAPLVEILKEIDEPLVQTSLNISGEPAIINSEKIPEELRMQLSYVHDYVEPNGVPSTIVKLYSDRFEIIRQGEEVVQ